MALEGWAVPSAIAAAALLATVLVAEWLATRVAWRGWNRVVPSLRGAAVVAVAVAWFFLGWYLEPSSPFDLRTLSWGVAWFLLPEAWTLARRLETDDALPVMDGAALGLILLGLLIRPPGAQPTLLGTSWLFWLYWIALLGGAAGALEAGCAGLVLVARRKSGWAGSAPAPGEAALLLVLRDATAGAASVIGFGLLAGAHSAWRTLGSLSTGDPREGWMVTAFLALGASLAAWRLGRAGRRWAVALAMLAAILALVGALLVVDLRALLWA